MPGIEVAAITLTDEDSAVITEITKRFPSELAVGCEAQAVDWIEEQTAEVSVLPDGLAALREAFGTDASVIHVNRELSGILPPTPAAYQPPEQAEIYSFDMAQLALTSIGGMAYGNRHVRNGRILADVFPKTSYAEKTDTAFGSSETFDFHSDGAVHYDTTPNFFSLHCVRNSEQAPTFFSSVNEQDFSVETFAALQEPVFTIYYEAAHDGTALEGVPIIEKEPSGKFRLNFYGRDKASGPGDELHENALDDFSKALDTNVQELTLQPGELVFVDNRHIQHGRRAFQAASSLAERRWLRRVFAGRDEELLSRIRDAEDRILDSTHAI